MSEPLQALNPARPNRVPLVQLLEREHSQLLGLARRMLWDAEEARDVVQSALTDALEQWDTLRDPAAAPAWLRRAVVHRAISQLRRRRVWYAVQKVLDFALPQAEPAPAPDEALMERQRYAALGRALAALPARQQAAFTLRYLEGLPIDEVAAAMNLDRGTVRVHLQRALRKLRDQGHLPPVQTKTEPHADKPSGDLP